MDCYFQPQQRSINNDIETKEEYWISGVKKNRSDRHWAGSGKILIDKKILQEYLYITEQKSIDIKKFELVDIPEEFPIIRINEFENKKKLNSANKYDTHDFLME